MVKINFTNFTNQTKLEVPHLWKPPFGRFFRVSTSGRSPIPLAKPPLGHASQAPRTRGHVRARSVDTATAGHHLEDEWPAKDQNCKNDVLMYLVIGLNINILILNMLIRYIKDIVFVHNPIPLIWIYFTPKNGSLNFWVLNLGPRNGSIQ